MLSRTSPIPTRDGSVWTAALRAPLALLFILSAGCADSPVATVPPTAPPGPDPASAPIDLSGSWTRATPVDASFDEVALEQAFQRATAEPNLHALAVFRHGHLVRDEYFHGTRSDTALDMRSVTKTVTALITGIAVDRGAIGLDARMVDWVDDDSERPEHAEIRLRHLLTMTSGMRWNDNPDYNLWVLSGDPIGYVLDQQVVAAPGQRFIYNTGGSHVIGAMVGEAIGGSILDFADQYLFGPLGITGREWYIMPDGQPMGGAGLALYPTDAAKIGQLLLQGGRSGARQLVSESWLAAQLAEQVALGDIGTVLEDAGYGYQTWSDTSGGGDGVAAFILWGYGGQFVWVVPDRRLVVVTAARWRQLTDPSGQAERIARDIVRPVIDAAEPIPN